MYNDNFENQLTNETDSPRDNIEYKMFNIETKYVREVIHSQQERLYNHYFFTKSIKSQIKKGHIRLLEYLNIGYLNVKK